MLTSVRKSSGYLQRERETCGEASARSAHSHRDIASTGIHLLMGPRTRRVSTLFPLGVRRAGRHTKDGLEAPRTCPTTFDAAGGVECAVEPFLSNADSAFTYWRVKAENDFERRALTTNWL